MDNDIKRQVVTLAALSGAFVAITAVVCELNEQGKRR